MRVCRPKLRERRPGGEGISTKCTVISTALLIFLFIAANAPSASAQPGSSVHRLSIDECVAQAILHSPQAEGVRITRDAALISAERDRPGSGPTLNLIAGGTLQGPHLTFPRPDGTAAAVLPEQAGRVSLIFEQPLYHSGLRQANSRYAAELELPGLELRREMASFVLSVKKAYIDVLRAETGIQIAAKHVDAATQFHNLALKQIDAGAAKPVDAETSNSAELESKAGLVQAEEALQLASLNFNRLLGRALDTNVLLQPLSGVPELPPAVKSAIEKALRERPEILALQKNIEAARAGLQLAKMGSTPSLSFRGEITRQTNTALLPSNYYAATIELKWPLLDMGKTRQDTREARTGILRLEAALEESKQSIAMEVTRAWIHLKTSLVRFDLIQQQSRGVAATATVAEKAYEVGRGTFFELQAANRQIKLADEGENQARYNVWEAQVEFESVQGTNIFDAHQTAARGRSK